jgi:hypothetical protein
MNYLAYFDDEASQEEERRVMGFYTSFLKRHMYVRGAGKRLLSKNVAFTPMIKALNRAFPDCRIVGTVRNPLKAIPSHISSMTAGAKIFDNDPKGYEFRDQLVDLQRYFYRHIMGTLPALPERRYMILTMEEMEKNIAPTVKRIYDRFGMEPGTAFIQRLEEEQARAMLFKSAHRYNLESFNISPDTIKEAFSDVFRRFGYDEDNPDGRTGADYAP